MDFFSSHRSLFLPGNRQDLVDQMEKAFLTLSILLFHLYLFLPMNLHRPYTDEGY